MNSHVKRTRISLIRLLSLVTYLSVLVFMITRRPAEVAYYAPLTWVYHFAREIPVDDKAWPYCVVGCLLLVGTVPPFFLVRWWTLATAIVCGVLYLLIGLAGAVHNFVL
jgi:hypothetical protein